MGKSCGKCHSEQSWAQGRFGEKCETCHTFDKWEKVRFNHYKDTKFKLKGSHSKLVCLDCHRGNAYKEKPGKQCIDCHLKVDVHKGKQGNECGTCHNEEDWGKQVRFDHDLARFPLIGIHATTSCESCHLTEEYQKSRKNCFECHQAKDVHKKKLRLQCETCHNPNAWNLWRFDHNTQTRFLLDGPHEELNCLACHTREARESVHFIRPMEFDVRSSGDLRTLIILVRKEHVEPPKAEAPTPDLGLPVPDLSVGDLRQAELMDETQGAMIDGNYRRAIQLYTKIL